MVTPTLDPDAVLWSHGPVERVGRPLLVLLHGYGADERDLFGLVPYLPDSFAVAAVRAPLTPPWPTPGASWYAIDHLERRDSAAITEGARSLSAWLDVAGEGAPVGLLGFSQGAAIALQAMRLEPQRYDYAVALSGYAATGDLPGDTELAERRPPVFWGRGGRDEVIPAELIAHTTAWLPAHSELSGRLYPDLGHAVSEPELVDVRAFLERRLAELDDAAA